MLITTVFKENANASRAEVMRNEAGGYYYVNYFDPGGNQVFTEAFPDKSLRYVEDAAENWAQGIKVLRG